MRWATATTFCTPTACISLMVTTLREWLSATRRRVGPKNSFSKFEGRQTLTFAASSRFSNSIGESSMTLAGVQPPLSSAAA